MENKKVLICDDDEGITEMLKTLFEIEGADVITENNSLEVFKLLNEQKPDLLILDLWMPVLSGDQLLKSIRQKPDTADIPVLVVSASQDGPAVAKEAGAASYVAKPFDIYKLLNEANSLLS